MLQPILAFRDSFQLNLKGRPLEDLRTTRWTVVEPIVLTVSDTGLTTTVIQCASPSSPVVFSTRGSLAVGSRQWELELPLVFNTKVPT